jgi:hypothetical protein
MSKRRRKFEGGLQSEGKNEAKKDFPEKLSFFSRKALNFPQKSQKRGESIFRPDIIPL